MFLDLRSGSAGHPCKLPASPPWYNLQRDHPWRLGKWPMSCTFQRTWCFVWIVWVGWWRPLSNSPPVWWECCYIPITHQIWWRLTILIICQWGWRWRGGDRHSWWYGYWDTGSLGRGVVFLASFFLTKKNSIAWGELEGEIIPVLRYSSMNFLQAWCSMGFSG